MARKPAVPARRPRTTKIHIVVPTTIKAVADQLGLNQATVAARYHRIQDAHPRGCVTLEALATSHKTAAYRGKFMG